MKREGKHTKKKDGLVNNYANSKKVMSSNLPLLFANGRPRSLETISQLELEEFVPFMILCSLGQELHLKTKEINNCPMPEWWPQGFPFKFPLVEQSDWINRQVMLKSLVCRCYTFYDCEFLLKFSSELAEMPPSSLKFQNNKDENTTSIYDSAGSMLVKCRNENIYYDMHKNRRRYLSPSHRSPMGQTKKFESVIDLTFDTSSEDEKEVYFKEAPAASRSSKRKSIEICDEPAKQRCIRRIFHDFPKEQPEPEVATQEQFMSKFEMIPKGKEIVKEIYKVERKKRLAHSFTILSVSSKRGQELLVRNKHSFNLEASLDRIDRYCVPNGQSEVENNQVCTRASLVFSAMFKEDLNKNEPVAETTEEDQFKWYHTYKWPHRTYNPRYPHKGPEVKPCNVVLTLLTEEMISYWTKRRRSIATMTPEKWAGKHQICACQKIPLITLDDDGPSKYKDKSSSTRCTCAQAKQHITPTTQIKKSSLEIKNETGNRDLQVNASSDTLIKARHRSISDSLFHSSRGFNVSGSTRSGLTHSVTYDKEGLGVISYNATFQNESSVNFKRALHRKPLAVVPPTPVVIEHEVTDISCQSITCHSQGSSPTQLMKVNFYRSILDAIKWYTKDDPIPESTEVLNECFVKAEVIFDDIDRSQENIKPVTELALPNSKKCIYYFQNDINTSERDYCFERASESSLKLVTRRGVRHYVNREPCPSCFQGRDNFCVYEFVRQAKLAGVTLKKNQKQLQLMFFNFLQTVNSKS